jgi:8-oxo-dGTP diphosphatase
MKEIAAMIFENQEWKLLFYLRDNIQSIPFPHHWDLIGGHIDPGETPEQALVREVEEEIGLQVNEYSYEFYKKFHCTQGDIYENIKYIYHGKIIKKMNELVLYEGEKLWYFSVNELEKIPFANIVGDIVLDFIREKG